LTFYYNKYL